MPNRNPAPDSLPTPDEAIEILLEFGRPLVREIQFKDTREDAELLAVMIQRAWNRPMLSKPGEPGSPERFLAALPEVVRPPLDKMMKSRLKRYGKYKWLAALEVRTDRHGDVGIVAAGWFEDPPS